MNHESIWPLSAAPLDISRGHIAGENGPFFPPGVTPCVVLRTYQEGEYIATSLTAYPDGGDRQDTARVASTKASVEHVTPEAFQDVLAYLLRLIPAFA